MTPGAAIFWSDHAKSGGLFPTDHLAAIFAGADPGDASKTASEIGLVFIAKRHRAVDQRGVRLPQHLDRHFETCGFDYLFETNALFLEFTLQSPWAILSC